MTTLEELRASAGKLQGAETILNRQEQDWPEIVRMINEEMSLLEQVINQIEDAEGRQGKNQRLELCKRVPSRAKKIRRFARKLERSERGSDNQKKVLKRLNEHLENKIGGALNAALAVSDRVSSTGQPNPRRVRIREKLKKRKGQRFRVTATIGAYRKRNGYKGWEPTVLLQDIQDAETGEELTDHLWMDVGKQLDRLDPKMLDKIAFDARVDSYEAGYRGNRTDLEGRERRRENPPRTDYRLVYPTKFEIVERGPNH